MKNKSHRYDVTDIGQDMVTNILNIKCVSAWWWLCAIKNT